MDKVLVMDEIDMINDMYCEGCLLKKHLIKDKGKTAAHRFCIKGCTVGEQLQFLGGEMNKMTK